MKTRTNRRRSGEKVAIRKNVLFPSRPADKLFLFFFFLFRGPAALQTQKKETFSIMSPPFLVSVTIEPFPYSSPPTDISLSVQMT